MNRAESDTIQSQINRCPSFHWPISTPVIPGPSLSTINYSLSKNTINLINLIVVTYWHFKLFCATFSLVKPPLDRRRHWSKLNSLTDDKFHSVWATMRRAVTQNMLEVYFDCSGVCFSTDPVCYTHYGYSWGSPTVCPINSLTMKSRVYFFHIQFKTLFFLAHFFFVVFV